MGVKKAFQLNKACMLKVRVQRHITVKGNFTFTINLPLQCSRCGYCFTRQVQVGVNNPIIPCPFCYSRNQLNLSWLLEKDKLNQGDIVKVIIY